MREWLLLIAGGAALGAVAYAVTRRRPSSPAHRGPVRVPLGVRVDQRARARGVDARLEAFLEWWERAGPFGIIVAPDGGVRTDAAAQRAYYLAGTSKAATLDDTPHGRGGALDVWPDGFDPAVPWESQPAEVRSRFGAIGRHAEAQGLVWGGRWTSFGGGTGDQPHLEVPLWRTLPFPSAGVA